MSLLGRLEDLSLTDIIQIVFLSRRTGVLEIVDEGGRHTVLFRHGVIVNASAPAHPDLITYLNHRGFIPDDKVSTIRQMEDSGIPCGNAVVDMNLTSPETLANTIRERITEVVTPLLQSREGEFNFLLSESMNAVDIEYEPDWLFKDGGFSPQKILGGSEGEKLKPLKGLEESLKAGKALLRKTEPEPPSTAGRLDVGLPGAAVREAPPENVVPFPSQFKVAGGLFEIESPEATYRNVVLFERDPLVRVAAKRAFGKNNVKIAQFGSLEDARAAMTELFRSNSLFITFLELSPDGSAVRLLEQLKRRNPRLPVVIIDNEADLRRRHDLLRTGADLYLTKPAPERLQPGLAEEELALFADELVLFAERTFLQWEQLTGSLGPEAGKRFYEMADKESVDRSFSVLKQLINELSNPNDIGQVASTILRLSSQYVDRGALFVTSDEAFVGVGGFGVTGGGEDMSSRVRKFRLARREPSVLTEVAESRKAHHGKIRRTPANIQLIERMGGLLPTEVVALPIMHGEQAIGILYGDNAENRAPIDSMTGLEIFLSQAGYAFGNAVFASQNAGRGREGV